MGSQQLSLEQRKVQRLSGHKRVPVVRVQNGRRYSLDFVGNYEGFYTHSYVANTNKQNRINCSQELNTLIWDSLSKGGSYESIEDIYFDVCKLSILSGCNIDSAKKEFVIDFKKELNIIRQKYRTKKKDKTTKPWFFAHIVKKKGFYDPTKKAYIKFDTSMDYLQEYINIYNKKRGYKKNIFYIPFSDVIKDKYFRNEYVDHSTITEIFNKANDLQRVVSEIYCNTKDLIQAYYDCIPYKCDFVDYLNQLPLNKSTIIALLQSVESRENSSHRMLFFYALFQKPNTLFLNYIRESKKYITSLISDVDGNINIYGSIFREN